jgi:hypothetical protein
MRWPQGSGLSMKKQKNETVPETPAAAQMHKHDD